MNIEDPNYYVYRLNRWTMKNNMPQTRYITSIRLLEYNENPEGTINQPTGYFKVSVGFATGMGNCAYWGLAYHKEMVYNPLTGNLSYPNGGGLHGHYANRAEAIEAVQIMTSAWSRQNEEEKERKSKWKNVKSGAAPAARKSGPSKSPAR